MFDRNCVAVVLAGGRGACGHYIPVATPVPHRKDTMNVRDGTPHSLIGSRPVICKPLKLLLAKVHDTPLFVTPHLIPWNKIFRAVVALRSSSKSASPLSPSSTANVPLLTCASARGGANNSCVSFTLRTSIKFYRSFSSADFRAGQTIASQLVTAFTGSSS